MIRKRRLDMIIGILKEGGMADVKALSQRLGVTEEAVKPNLEELENQNLLERVHGGTMLRTQGLSLGYKDFSRRTSHLEQKQVITRRALTLIEENGVILPGDRSTTQEVAKLLGDFRVAVLTNDLLIMNELMYKPNITPYIIGELVCRDSDSYIVTGEDTIQFLKKYHVSELFLGTSTIDVKEGLMVFNYGDNFTKRAFIDATDRVVCLAGSSRLDHTASTKVARLSEMDTSIMDNGLSQGVIRRYKSLGREIIVT